MRQRKKLGLLGIALVAAATLGLTLSTSPQQATAKAGAAAGKGGKTRFFEFTDFLVDGNISKPAAIYTQALKDPRFDRLLRLQKSFLIKLLSTSRYPSLRWVQ